MQVNLALVADAALAVKIHLATVLPAFAIGSWMIFASTKGSRAHRAWGRLYLVLMTVTAIDAFFVRELDPGRLTLVHLLIPLTLFGVFGAIWNLRRGNIPGHRNAMISLYVGALVIAGGLTFLPGRLMHRMFFG